MKRSEATAIKSAPGKCKLTVIETPTRDAICSDTGGDTVTIAYVAIGAEAWGPLLAAAPDMAAALQAAAKLIDAMFPGVRHIALQDYKALNETPLAIAAALRKAAL